MDLIFGLLGKVPFLVWPLLVVALWGTAQSHRANEAEASLLRERAAIQAQVLTAQVNAAKRQQAQNDLLKEKLDEQSKDLDRMRSDAVSSADAVARLRARLASIRAGASAGDPSLATVRASVETLSNLFGRGVERYQRLGERADDTYGRGAECERRYDTNALTPK